MVGCSRQNSHSGSRPTRFTPRRKSSAGSPSPSVLTRSFAMFDSFRELEAACGKKSYTSRENYFDSISGFLAKANSSTILPPIKCSWNDALQNFRRTTVIPDALGINHRHRPAHADAQAVGLGAKNQRLRADEIQFLQPPLQKFPGQRGWFHGRSISAPSRRRTGKCDGGIFRGRAWPRRLGVRNSFCFARTPLRQR